MKVLAFGEILWDIIEGVEYLGGAPFNFAAHSVQCGNEALIVSRVGSDVRGMRAWNQCKLHKVKHDLIQFDEERPTGTVTVTLSEGQPDYVIHENVAYDFIEDSDLLRKLENNSADVVYFGSLAQRSEKSRQTLYELLRRVRCKHVFYDVNLRKGGYTDSILRDSLLYATMFKLNLDELPVISKILVGSELQPESFCRAITDMFSNIVIVIITAADKGCFVFDKKFNCVPGVQVEVTDAVGAGDAFSAAFMHSYLLTRNTVHAARIANEVGAYVATKSGAIPMYSDLIKEVLGLDRNILAEASEPAKNEGSIL
jgi:fructokinase